MKVMNIDILLDYYLNCMKGNYKTAQTAYNEVAEKDLKNMLQSGSKIL
jgi:hypothetical protein